MCNNMLSHEINHHLLWWTIWLCLPHSVNHFLITLFLCLQSNGGMRTRFVKVVAPFRANSFVMPLKCQICRNWYSHWAVFYLLQFKIWKVSILSTKFNGWFDNRWVNLENLPSIYTSISSWIARQFLRICIPPWSWCHCKSLNMKNRQDRAEEIQIFLFGGTCR